jgi:hypothetical protein
MEATEKTGRKEADAPAEQTQFKVNWDTAKLKT